MIQIANFYLFRRLPLAASLPGILHPQLDALGVTGTVLVAPEGLNGSLAGSAESIAGALAALERATGGGRFDPLLSRADAPPFAKLEVRLRREIVSLGRPDIDPARGRGADVAPADWNALAADPDTILLDTRNAFETAIGGFPGAWNPGLSRFRDFPDWWRGAASAAAGKRVAMFCTGGIRCEKAGALLAQSGAADVVQLRGGILAYLRDVPARDSLWRGGCFVFDRRVALGQGLAPTGHSLCHGCRRPLTEADRRRADYEEGVACRHCAGHIGPAGKASRRERHRQIALAAARGGRHLAAGISRD